MDALSEVEGLVRRMLIAGCLVGFGVGLGVGILIGALIL